MILCVFTTSILSVRLIRIAVNWRADTHNIVNKSDEIIAHSLIIAAPILILHFSASSQPHLTKILRYSVINIKLDF